MPKGMDASKAAPLMCAGVTVYSPLKHWHADDGKTVGIVGVGGLGHLAVKYARAMGAHVVAFTTSESKMDEIKQFGAHEVVYSRNQQQMQAQTKKIDLMIDTVSSSYPMDAFMMTLKLDGIFCSLGLPPKFDLTPVMLTMGRRSLVSSGTGGTKDTREMLEFSAKYNIYPKIEFIKPEEINTALDRLEKNDVRYRFVMDLTKNQLKSH